MSGLIPGEGIFTLSHVIGLAIFLGPNSHQRRKSFIIGSDGHHGNRVRAAGASRNDNTDLLSELDSKCGHGP